MDGKTRRRGDQKRVIDMNEETLRGDDRQNHLVSPSPRPRVAPSPRRRVSAWDAVRVNAAINYNRVRNIHKRTDSHTSFAVYTRRCLSRGSFTTLVSLLLGASGPTNRSGCRSRAGQRRAVRQSHRSIDIASSAATGFGLTALCIAAERGWFDRKAVRERVLTTLRFYAERSPHEHGWFYHFVDRKTGERRWRSEISTIDTALLLGGVLTARQYFRQDPEIVGLATLIYERIDFPWMLLKTHCSSQWVGGPKQDSSKVRWNHYSEHTMLQLLAIGSPTHPISPGAWQAWHRLRLTYGGYTYLTFLGAPLFIHQYSQAWVDYRDQEESWYPYTNYFENSVNATLAHREFCWSLSDKFPGYSENVWGITASDSAKGYRAWGGPPPTNDIDGTVVPCAAGGSLMFTPEITLAALKTMHQRWGDRIYDSLRIR